MPYSVKKTALDSVLLLQPKVFSDPRGFFFESFNQREFNQVTGLDVVFVQDNHSKSVHGVLRGLHFQNNILRANWSGCRRVGYLTWQLISAPAQRNAANGPGMSWTVNKTSNCGYRGVMPTDLLF